jgi:hypothetical protein
MATQVTTGAPAIQSTSDRAISGDRRVVGVLLSAISGSFLLVTMLAASIAPGYDFHAAAISDLGVIAETATLFNVLLVALGLMNIAVGYLLYRRRSPRPCWPSMSWRASGRPARAVPSVDRRPSQLCSP